VIGLNKNRTGNSVLNSRQTLLIFQLETQYQFAIDRKCTSKKFHFRKEEDLEKTNAE